MVTQEQQKYQGLTFALGFIRNVAVCGLHQTSQLFCERMELVLGCRGKTTNFRVRFKQALSADLRHVSAPRNIPQCRQSQVTQFQSSTNLPSNQVLPAVILIRTLVIFYQYGAGERGRERENEYDLGRGSLYTGLKWLSRKRRQGPGVGELRLGLTWGLALKPLLHPLPGILAQIGHLGV